ncbi:hypothetical protein Poli38472_009612 [Pythium oligandrum]|uniref:Uncharacterized protein n=1 Tax=Pythium oligandrum TaxID=41045 RepID=A0A8K1CFK1_PYTOL|nr:hypothetical protein Poli38472_009612 [Pythium oligandrum]|eukprot:TMW62119.1 hypothetical protein Poli38472_009612 [Pythium oligandrum]
METSAEGAAKKAMLVLEVPGHPKEVECPELSDARLASRDALLDALTLPYPHYLPMQFEFEQSELYARQCYTICYARIMHLFDVGTCGQQMRHVTVTGTPGNGKSVFLAYCFLRYRLEHPDARIIVLSYNRQSKLKRRFVWIDGQGYEIPSSIALLNDEKTITLIDGPPDVEPNSCRWICFTSPNKTWEATMHKDTFHSRLFHPLWDYEELYAAACVLNLMEQLEPVEEEERQLYGFEPNVNPEVNEVDAIKVRTIIFGFVARVCLYPGIPYEAFESLLEAINSMKSADLEPVLVLEEIA